MEVSWYGLLEAIRLLLSGNPEVYEVIFRTVHVSGTATIIGMLIGLPWALCWRCPPFRAASW